MISSICKKYGIENYTINPDGSIDVNDGVWLYNKNLTELPLVFNKVTGYFDCGINKLTTLKGSPRWIGGYFSCSRNNLTSLEFGPDYVFDSFWCRDNQLTSLEFSPDYIGGDFYCNRNQLIDNLCESEIKGSFYTTFEQNGLNFNNINMVTNYNEWRKLYKRKQTLNNLFNI